MFVTFKYAELRNVFLKGFRDSDRIRVSDVDPSFRNSSNDNDLKVYELFAPEKYSLFVDARSRARDIGVTKMWHTNGTIYARRDNVSKSIRVTRLADLDKLRRD